MVAVCAVEGYAREYAGRPIGHAQRRNAEPGDARQVACLALIGAGRFCAPWIMAIFSVERHLAEKLVDARITGDHRNAGLRKGRGAESK